MPNLVEPLRNAILGRFPEAVVERRGERLLLMRRGNRYFGDYGIGALHYQDNGWQEVNTDFVNSRRAGYADYNETAKFICNIDANTGRHFVPRRSVPGEYMVLGRPEYWSGAQWRPVNLPGRVRSGQQLSWGGADLDFAIEHQGTRLKYSATLKNNALATDMRWAYTLTGLTLDSNWNLVSQSDRQIVGIIRVPAMTDAAKVTRAVTATRDGGFITLMPDYSGLVYPIAIDPTIDVVVGASADDSWQRAAGYNGVPSQGGGSFRGDPTGGYYIYVAARFQVTGPGSGVTVDIAYTSWYGGGTGQVMESTAHCEAVDSAGVFTSGVNDISNRSRTTGVTWGPTSYSTFAYCDSPSMVSDVQAVLNRAGWASGNYLGAILVATSATNYIDLATYDSLSSWAPKLHLEYTASAPARTNPPPIFRV